MPAPVASRAGVAYPARCAFQRVGAERTRRVSVVARADNPFAKIGTQLQKAGSQLTERLTGTAQVARRGKANDSVVFVAGATGRLGARIVKQALLAGFRVRAGVRSEEKAQQLLSDDGLLAGLKPGERRRLDFVEFDLFDEESIVPAIGNAGATHHRESGACMHFTAAVFAACTDRTNTRNLVCVCKCCTESAVTSRAANNCTLVVHANVQGCTSKIVAAAVLRMPYCTL